MRLTPSAASSPTGGASGVTRTFTGRSTEAISCPYLGRIDHTRGEQDIGPRLLVGLQAGDRVGQVDPAVQVVLGPGGQDEGNGPPCAASAAARTRSVACASS